MITTNNLYMIRPEGEPIKDPEQFLDIYGCIYDYLNRDKALEDKITGILSRGLDGSDIDDVGAVISWKAGGRYWPDKKIVTYQYAPQDGIDVRKVKEVIEKNSRKTDADIFRNMILECADDKEIRNMGVVYTIVVVYFMTQGRYPIYDKYAHIALLTLTNGENGKLYSDERLRPYSPAEAAGEKRFEKYCDYRRLSDEVYQMFHVRPDNAEDLRRADKALWAYGHLFYEKN